MKNKIELYSIVTIFGLNFNLKIRFLSVLEQLLIDILKLLYYYFNIYIIIITLNYILII